MQAASEFASSSAFDSQAPQMLLLGLQTLYDLLANRPLCKWQIEHFSPKTTLQTNNASLAGLYFDKWPHF